MTNIHYTEVTLRCLCGIVMPKLSCNLFSPNFLRTFSLYQAKCQEIYSIQKTFKPARCWWWANNQITRHFKI